MREIFNEFGDPVNYWDLPHYKHTKELKENLKNRILEIRNNSNLSEEQKVIELDFLKYEDEMLEEIIDEMDKFYQE